MIVIVMALLLASKFSLYFTFINKKRVECGKCGMSFGVAKPS